MKGDLRWLVTLLVACMISAPGTAKDDFIDTNDLGISDPDEPWRDIKSSPAPKDSMPKDSITQLERGRKPTLEDETSKDKALVKEAVDLLVSYISCAPPFEAWYKKPPNEQLSGFTDVKYDFNGDEEVFDIYVRRTEKFHNVYNKAEFDTGYKVNIHARYYEFEPAIHVDGAQIKLNCRADTCLKGKKLWSETQHMEEISSLSLSILFCDADTASRIAKALSFLIKHNGGRPSPF